MKTNAKIFPNCFADGWNSEAGTKQNIPVRYDVFGKLKNNPFHVIYDFYFFQYRDRFWFEDEVAEFEVRNRKKYYRI